MSNTFTKYNEQANIIKAFIYFDWKRGFNVNIKWIFFFLLSSPQ